ncbi:MAG: hypothetical protein PHE83_16585 [Opitutaceae bacterium]|nr:hypothetical protein [Opitutaceae bacterium]
MTTRSAEEISDYCLNLHFPSWDTLGREESSLPADVSVAGLVYAEVDLPVRNITGLDDPTVEIDEVKVGEYARRCKQGVPMPPPVLGSDLTPIDGWHRCLALVKAGIPRHRFWVPANLLPAIVEAGNSGRPSV